MLFCVRCEPPGEELTEIVVEFKEECEHASGTWKEARLYRGLLVHLHRSLGTGSSLLHGEKQVVAGLSDTLGGKRSGD